MDLWGISCFVSLADVEDLVIILTNLVILPYADGQKENTSDDKA